MEEQLALPIIGACPFNGCSALGSKVRPNSTVTDEVHDELRDAGWWPTGDGSFTSVYISPDENRVLKFAEGPGQRATVEAALKNPDNPHFPRIYGVVDLAPDEDGMGPEFAYETELLEHIEGLDDDWEYDEDGNRIYPEEFRRWRNYWKPDFGPRRLKRKRNGPMKEALKALNEAKEEYEAQWDIHPWNIMVRPDTGELVLNDLLS